MKIPEADHDRLVDSLTAAVDGFEGSLAPIAAALSKGILELNEVTRYIEMNLAGFRKILKKRTKKLSGEKIPLPYANRLCPAAYQRLIKAAAGMSAALQGEGAEEIMPLRLPGPEIQAVLGQGLKPEAPQFIGPGQWGVVA